MNLFLTPPYNIYTYATGFVFLLSLLEIIMFTVGVSLSKFFTHDIDIDHSHHNHWSGLDQGVTIESVNLLNLGKVPFFLILVCIAGFFGFSGISIHLLLKSLGMSLSNLFVLPLSVLFSTLLTYATTSIWSKFFPNEETYSISEKEYIGNNGIVNLGTGDRDNAVEVSTYDKYGNKHFIMAQVALPNVKVNEGEKVIIVARENNKHFLVLPLVEILQEDKQEKEIEI